MICLLFPFLYCDTLISRLLLCLNLCQLSLLLGQPWGLPTCLCIKYQLTHTCYSLAQSYFLVLYRILFCSCTSDPERKNKPLLNLSTFEFIFKGISKPQLLFLKCSDLWTKTGYIPEDIFKTELIWYSLLLTFVNFLLLKFLNFK